MKESEFKKWWCGWTGSDKLPENTDIIYAFEAGQQSQQAKIDELQRKIAFQEKAIKNIKLQFENKQIDCDRSDRKIDELQARIDGALKILDGMRHNGAYRAIDILKGNKDEN